MKFAYPINDKGTKIGEVQSFSDMVWERIAAQKVKRWVLTEDPRLKNKVVEKTVVIKPVAETKKAVKNKKA